MKPSASPRQAARRPRTDGVRIIGVGELAATRTPGEAVRTLALGSCVAVILLDAKTRTVGMAHIALPESAVSPARARERPGHFADTGVPALIDAMKHAGAQAQARSYIVKLVGGASVADPNRTFNIGKRNLLAIRKVLWQYGMGAIAEDVGGSISRSVTVDTTTGRVHLSSPGREPWTI